ncbi:MAG TPA: hypothetical protein P5550_04570 [Bacteroidales bacterium]|nr:hypothetical protein [Bacteroidales bacterium]
MKSRHNLLLLLLPLLMLSAGSCTEDDRACTEEFVMLTISLSYPDTSPVLLDDYTVTDLSSGQVLSLSGVDQWIDSVNRLEGRYFLLTDGEYGLTDAQGWPFRFQGYIDTTEVVSRTFSIRNDGCHVRLASGNPDIVINP